MVGHPLHVEPFSERRDPGASLAGSLLWAGAAHLAWTKLLAVISREPFPPVLQLSLFRNCADLSGFALIDDQVEAGRKPIAQDSAQECMRLTAVVGLMIEKMVESGSERLFDILRINNRPIADRLRKIVVAQAGDVAKDAFILLSARRAQLCEIVMEYHVESGWGFALACEALHPDAISNQKVIEGAVQRFKEGSAIGTIVGIGDPCGRVK